MAGVIWNFVCIGQSGYGCQSSASRDGSAFDWNMCIASIVRGNVCGYPIARSNHGDDDNEKTKEVKI